jgi:hypothetical protein
VVDLVDPRLAQSRVGSGDVGTCFPHPFFWVYERFSERSLTSHLS